MTDQDVATIIISHIAERVRRLCIRRGYLDPDGAIVQSPDADSLFADHDALTQATQSSIAGKIAFGARAGQYVRRIGGGFGYEEEVPLAKGRLCFAVNGLSLHANTAINTHARDRLAQLVEYLARGPISNERLEIIADGPDAGDIKLALKTAWRSGTTHLRLSPSEFVEKLVSLIPPPKSHLVRWGGVFASNSPYRSCITLRPSVKKGFQFGHACDEVDQKGKSGVKFKNHTWSAMLKRVFKIDVTICIDCGGDMRKVAAITNPMEVRRYLQHVNMDYEPPARAPPRMVQGELDLVDELSYRDEH